MTGRVTMAAVAKRADVHVTTVSAALRNHRSLPLSTRQRIQALAKEMGYRPDPALASLVAYRSKLRPRQRKLPLAYITNWQSMWGWKEAPAHAEFFAGASARAPELGYKLEHFWLGAPSVTHQRMSEILYTRGITGVIFASHLRQFDAAIDFDWSKFSAVKIDFAPHRPAMHNVTNDQRGIMQLAVQRVMQAGYRRIGCIMPYWWDECVDRAWSAGFLAEQQALAPSDRIPILMYYDKTAGLLVPRESFAAWYGEYRPEVVISYGPFVLPHLKPMGLSVPGDLAFVDVFLTEIDGDTAGVRHNCRRVGELAVEMLVGQLQQFSFGLPTISTSTFVEGTWFEGKSLPLRQAEGNEPTSGAFQKAG